MTVWVVNRVTDNIAKAEAFGGLRFINDRYVYGDELEQRNETQTEWVTPWAFRGNLLDAVMDFEPEFDYLLIAGDHLQLVLFAGMLAQRHGTFRVLRYDRKLNDYIPVRMDFPLAPDAQPVLTSPPNIGDTSGQISDEDLSPEEFRFLRKAESLLLDGPHRPRKR